MQNLQELLHMICNKLYGHQGSCSSGIYGFGIGNISTDGRQRKLSRDFRRKIKIIEGNKINDKNKIQTRSQEIKDFG